MPDLLDTNIISEPRKPRPDPQVIAYIKGRPMDELFISTLTVAELQYGIGIDPSPVRRAALNDWLLETIIPFFTGRTLEVTVPVLLRWRMLMEVGRRSGRTFSQPDLLLAATALEHNLTLITRNIKDFTSIPDLKVSNPWEPLS